MPFPCRRAFDDDCHFGRFCFQMNEWLSMRLLRELVGWDPCQVHSFPWNFLTTKIRRVSTQRVLFTRPQLLQLQHCRNASENRMMTGSICSAKIVNIW